MPGKRIKLAGVDANPDELREAFQKMEDGTEKIPKHRKTEEEDNELVDNPRGNGRGRRRTRPSGQSVPPARP